MSAQLPKFDDLRSSAQSRAVSSEKSSSFRQRFFPQTTVEDWRDWRWQMRSRIRSLAQVEQVFQISADERAALEQHKTGLPVGITPYYASIMGLDDPSEPLRRTHIPVEQEYLKTLGEADDPLS